MTDTPPEKPLNSYAVHVEFHLTATPGNFCVPPHEVMDAPKRAAGRMAKKVRKLIRDEKLDDEVLFVGAGKYGGTFNIACTQKVADKIAAMDGVREIEKTADNIPRPPENLRCFFKRPPPPPGGGPA